MCAKFTEPNEIFIEFIIRILELIYRCLNYSVCTFLVRNIKRNTVCGEGKNPKTKGLFLCVC